MQHASAGMQQHRHTAVTHSARRTLLVVASFPRPGQPLNISHLVSRCTVNVQQAWAAAAAFHQQHPHSNRGTWQQSLGIGVGLQAVASTGAGGGFFPPNNSGWSSGGGGNGWGHSPGSSGQGSNVLSDVAAAGEVADAAFEEVVLLDVGGMKCGGCVGHVKKLLEDHPSVTAATVNLATETALVRVVLEPGADLSTLAAELAKALTSAGFPAKVSKKQITADMRGS